MFPAFCICPYVSHQLKNRGLYQPSHWNRQKPVLVHLERLVDAPGAADDVAAVPDDFPQMVFTKKFLPTFPDVWPYQLIFNSVDIL